LKINIHEHVGSPDTLLINLPLTMDEGKVMVSPTVIIHNGNQYEMPEFETAFAPDLRIWFNSGKYSLEGERLSRGAFLLAWEEGGRLNTIRYVEKKLLDRVKAIFRR
jgi:hypothetical protein